MAGKATGTYYLSLDGAGNPLVSTSADGTTTRQFSWDAGSHRISAKALFAGVDVFLTGMIITTCWTPPPDPGLSPPWRPGLKRWTNSWPRWGVIYAFDRQDGLDFLL